MSPDALAVLAAVLGTGCALAAVVRFEGRRTRERVDYLMRAAGIEVPGSAGRRALAHETAPAKGEPRSVQADAPAGPSNGRDHEVERALAALAGMRAVRETDS